MSRHLIEQETLREVWVGWDPPLGTFFAQIYAPQVPDDEEELIWWIGERAREVTSLDELALALEEQGVKLRPAIRARLAEDEPEPWEPGPLQRRFGFTGKEGA